MEFLNRNTINHFIYLISLPGELSQSPSSLSSSNNGETILDCVLSPQYNDISMYRTPSGNYYCKICNINLPDVKLFQQHLDSKKHHKNIKAAKTTTKSSTELSSRNGWNKKNGNWKKICDKS